MSDYKSAINEFDKSIVNPQTAIATGEEGINVAQSTPYITGYEISSSELDTSTILEEGSYYLEPKAIEVKRYRLKK